MTKLEKVMQGLECCKTERCSECPYECPYTRESECLETLIVDALDLLRAQQWRKFEFREPDADEKASHPDWVKVLIGGPDDGEEIIVTNGRYVWKDEFCIDDECYLDCSNADLEECWWMPLPSTEGLSDDN